MVKAPHLNCVNIKVARDAKKVGADGSRQTKSRAPITDAEAIANAIIDTDMPASRKLRTLKRVLRLADKAGA